MKKIIILAAFIFSIHAAMAQANSKVTKISLGTELSGSLKGDLANGEKMADISWAWSSANACFPETQKRKFTGNHVLYQIDLPVRSEMEITVIPDDKNADFSIYAYQVGQGKEAVVPNLSSCIRCEADHKWDYKKRGQTQDHTRKVKDLVAISEPYTVYFGIVGANGLDKGGFTIQVKLTK